MTAGDLFDLTAEQGVIGALLWDNALFAELPRVRGDDFYDPLHAHIFVTAGEMVRTGKIADAMTMREALREHPGLREVGGAGYILTLLDSAARLRAHAFAYAGIVADLAQRRRLADAAAALSARTLTDSDPSAILADAERALADIGARDITADEWTSFGAIAATAIDRAESGEAAGLSTGIPDLDDCTGGIRPGTLWIVGGASSMGKSIVGQQLAVNIAEQGFGVGYVHLEMDPVSIGLRGAAGATFDKLDGANPHYLSALRRKLTQPQWTRMRAGARRLATLPVMVDARPGQTMTQIESRARRLKRRFERNGQQLAALVIDHEGLIVSERTRDSKAAEAGDRAIRLLALAKALDVGVVALTQLNRDGAKKDGKEALPEMTDLAWSAELERCAEVVALLHRKAYYAERKPEALRSAEDEDALRSREALLVIAKSRAGMRRHVRVIVDVKSAAMLPDGAAP